MVYIFANLRFFVTQAGVFAVLMGWMVDTESLSVVLLDVWHPVLGIACGGAPTISRLESRP